VAITIKFSTCLVSTELANFSAYIVCALVNKIWQTAVKI